jgi:GNAT superfamily N-acetyltransferase
MWRPAEPRDDEAIIRMSVALNDEDPGPNPVPPEHMMQTLRVLRASPERGRLIVLELDGRPCGYTLLMKYWSNELGGEVCTVDELYVAPEYRGRGHALNLLETIAAKSAPWTIDAVALALETTPDNTRARRLYERAGFVARNIAMRRLLER